MKIGINSLRSRVSRRIFIMFFIAAFLPVLLISIISYYHINRQMTEQVEQQLHREARNIGHAFFDRLLTLEALLGSIRINGGDGVAITHALNMPYFQDKFSDINLISPGGEVRVLMGGGLALPALSEDQQAHLASGNSIVAVLESDAGRRLIMLSYTMPRLQQEGQIHLLAATPDHDYLYNFGVLEPQLACALTLDGWILDCSSPVPPAELGNIETRRGSLGFQNWGYRGEAYTLYIWNLFLDAQYQLEDLAIMTAVPARSSLANITSFNTIFLNTLLITILLVVALSIVAIRRNLDPLEQLIEGTRRIMQGIFNKPVAIRSNDEFETLADSFNNMAVRIDEQIQTLTMMSRIDRMILASHDAKEIIQALIEYGHLSFPVNHMVVMTVDIGDPSRGVLTCNASDTIGGTVTMDVELDDRQLKLIDSRIGYVWLDDSAGAAFLAPLKAAGDRVFLVFPMKVNRKITGMICLCNPGQFTLGEVKLGELRDLADRVAVALSNAAWEYKLYYQAHYDAVTGLPNRYLLKDRLEQAVSKSIRADAGIAVLLIDLDQFKTVNDTMGHKVGDELLMQVGQRLASCVRASDTLARFGGDEFVIIIDVEEEGEDIIMRASRLAQRVQRQFTTPFHMKGREVTISSSIGVSVCPDNSRDVDDLLKQADSAMYQAKNEGRGQYRFFTQSLNESLVKRMELEADLRHALERGELHLNYQPKVSAGSGRITGVEVLLRWDHPVRGRVQPEEFVPVAEETGMLVGIGAWILRSACATGRDWLDRGLGDIKLAVNISGVQFRHGDLEQLLQRVLAETGLPPASLELEITETIAIRNFDETIRLLGALHNTGISIAIDDFGTGYSSMSYLNQFRIDKLKIDKSFVSGIPEQESSQSIARAIMGHSLGFTVVAEGVETEAQHRFLVEAGIDELQGYYVSRPLPLAEFENFYQEFTSLLAQRN